MKSRLLHRARAYLRATSLSRLDEPTKHLCSLGSKGWHTCYHVPIASESTPWCSVVSLHDVDLSGQMYRSTSAYYYPLVGGGYLRYTVAFQYWRVAEVATPLGQPRPMSEYVRYSRHIVGGLPWLPRGWVRHPSVMCSYRDPADSDILGCRHLGSTVDDPVTTQPSISVNSCRCH